MEMYIREINRLALMTAEEEQALARRVRSGDAAARSEFIARWTRYVVTVCRTMRRRDEEIEEIVSAGNVGLIRAVERFDPEREVRFSTYATYWIKQAVRRWRHNDGLIRVPVYLQRTTQCEHRPDCAASMARARRTTLSDDLSWFVDSRADPARSGEERESTAHQIDAVFALLTDQEATILRMRYGLDGGPPRLLREIGEILGVSRTHVQEIVERIARRIRKAKIRERTCG